MTDYKGNEIIDGMELVLINTVDRQFKGGFFDPSSKKIIITQEAKETPCFNKSEFIKPFMGTDGFMYYTVKNGDYTITDRINSLLIWSSKDTILAIVGVSDTEECYNNYLMSKNQCQ